MLLAYSVIASGQVGFLENKGQLDSKVAYQAEYHGHNIYLNQKGFSVLLYDDAKWGNMVMDFHDNEMHNHDTSQNIAKFTLAFHQITYELVGANLSNHSGVESGSEYYNFFIGNDPSKWAANVKKYFKVVYTNIYPNIDLEYEAIDQRFKYNFILRPGAKIEDILLKIKGANSVQVASDRITVETRFGNFDEVMPISYEVVGESKTQIRMNYVERGDYIGFETPYFKGKVKTVIDPELIFSTYSGSSVDNFGFTATYDDFGNLYSGGIATGITKFLDGKYPTTPGAFDQTYNGGEDGFPCDIAISKYSSDGSTLLYATYLGGVANDYPHSLIVDKNNQLIVFGTSSSIDYPVTSGTIDPTYNGNSDIILTKLNAASTALIGSTFIGGNRDDGLNTRVATNYFYADDYRGEVNLDSNGLIYVATSSSSDNFPTTAGALQPIKRGANQDGVVFCVDPNITNLIWSTFLGGTEDDALYSIDIVPDGSVYVAGGTGSSDIDNTIGGYQPATNGGRCEGFISRLNNAGSKILQSTYFGTSAYDQILLADIDKYGNVFVVGHSEGNMPVVSAGYTNSGGKQFISKLSADLTKLLVSTVYGSGKSKPDITVNAFLVDDCGKVYVSGWGSDSHDKAGWSLSDMPITADAFQKTTDKKDFHLVVFEKDMSELLFGTYYGGNQTGDHVDGGTSRFDKRGIVYHSVCSSCPLTSRDSRISDFPTTSGAYAESNPSPRCSNASFKMAVVPFNEKPDLQSVIFNTIISDTVRVAVFDSFEFNYSISDKENDSLFVTFDIPADLKSSLTEYKEEYIGIGEIDAYFKMLFTCKNAGKTYLVKVHAKDVGCPFSEEDSATITIIVAEPEKLPPPEVLCLNFQQNNDLRVDWISTPESYYFYRMLLFKESPNGSISVLDTIYSQNAGSYLDSDVLRPREQEYKYYLVVEDICGYKGDVSYILSTTKESEVPVEATYLKTATVNNGKVNVVFLKSKEEDFGHYELYKGTRGGGSFKYLASIIEIDDTVYVDEDVDVQNKSYCYQIRVADNCGHLSKASNTGCTIVIDGVAINEKGETPRFKFDLHWDDYIHWYNGVDDYELLRAVDTGSLRSYAIVTNPKLLYTDENLDFDWGGYWYSVIAHESEGYQAQSRSNDIYLVQPPLVFVPNAVTANGDGLNENFGWSDVFVRDFEMQIYNRWGEKVFETTDKNAEWTGKYKGENLKYSNVYFWLVSYKGWNNIVYRENGTLTILK